MCLVWDRVDARDREDKRAVLLLSYWRCPGFDSNSERAVAGVVDVPTFVGNVVKQQRAFDDEPEVWETLSHFEVNFLL
eukprot:1292113-Rhodomonas_salina.1